MRGSNLFLTTCVAIVLVAAANTSQSYAQVRGDLRAGFFTNWPNASLGAGIIGGIAPNVYVNPMIEYVFVSGPRVYCLVSTGIMIFRSVMMRTFGLAVVWVCSM
jgi:hypothetical protein